MTFWLGLTVISFFSEKGQLCHMCKFLFFLIIGFFFSCLAEAQQRTLTFLTFNIYHGENPYHAGESNLAEVAALIQKYQPDFVALQEVDSMTVRSASSQGGRKVDLAAELAELTGMHGYFAKAIDFSQGGYGEAILSKWPLEFSTISLPTPMGGEGRSMAFAKVEFSDGKEFIFAGTHLCHEFEANRNAQTEEIIRQLLRHELPVVIAGDFNFEPNERAYGILSKDFLDAALLLNASPAATYPAEAPTSRIDYFWISQDLRGTVISIEVLDVDFSDHRPILMKLKMD
ncbi:Putative secreted protein [Mariniradius saccharolyticus AK6]|uniref:Secreted protein n=2 Tax=Mariniradius TaxID=1245590 RepID=M7XJN1_9BACT|nr:Putative secreted protein [Mariniradius saccharolyticus AK6]